MKWLAVIPAAMVLVSCSDGEGRAHPALRRALEARERGDNAEAKAQFERFIRKYPDSKTGRFAAAAFYSECLSDHQAAAWHYRRALEMDSSSELARGLFESERRADMSTAEASPVRQLEKAKLENAELRRLIVRQNRRINAASASASGMEALRKECEALRQELKRTKALLAELRRENEEAKVRPPENASGEEKGAVTEKNGEPEKNTAVSPEEENREGSKEK